MCEVQDWLEGRNLTATQRGEFDQFDGKDLLALQKNGNQKRVFLTKAKNR